MSVVLSMVIGFSAEVEFEGASFHIQTEARKEANIESAVYAKRAVVHTPKTSHPGLSTPQDGNGQFILLLEDQHCRVITQVRAGEIRRASVVAPGSDPPGEL